MKRAQPQQTGVVSEQPPSKQVGIFLLSALLFAVLSVGLAACPPPMLGAVSDKATLIGQAWTARLPSTLEGGRGQLNALELGLKSSNLF